MKTITEIGRCAEAGLLLTMATAGLRCLPFRTVARWLGKADDTARPDVLRPPEEDRALMKARAVALAVDRAARRLPWRSTCLARAMAGRAMLARRGIVSAVRFGVAAGEGPSRIKAHAWLCVGAVPVLGAREAAVYQPIATFERPISESRHRHIAGER